MKKKDAEVERYGRWRNSGAATLLPLLLPSTLKGDRKPPPAAVLVGGGIGFGCGDARGDNPPQFLYNSFHWSKNQRSVLIVKQGACGFV